jgi:hypothetical protein
MTSRSADAHSNGTLLSTVALLTGTAALVLAVFPGVGVSLLNLKGVGWGVVLAVLPTAIIAVASGWTAYRGLKSSPSKTQRVADLVALTLAGLALVTAVMFLTLGMVGSITSS